MMIFFRNNGWDIYIGKVFKIIILNLVDIDFICVIGI